MCICVCICANNMQILGFGGLGGVRSGGGYHWGGRGGGVGVRGPGSYKSIYNYIIYWQLTFLPRPSYLLLEASQIKLERRSQQFRTPSGPRRSLCQAAWRRLDQRPPLPKLRARFLSSLPLSELIVPVRALPQAGSPEEVGLSRISSDMIRVYDMA